MADVKWIKIVTDVFDNRKIKLIRKMPEGAELVVTWFQLLCLAGETNDNGLIYVTKTIPYTEETLATAFDTPLPIIRLALDTFTNLEMIAIYDTFFCIANWEKYQNCDALEKIKEQTKKRVAKHRAKQKELSGCNVTVTLPVTHCNATEEDKEEDKEIKNIKKGYSDSFLTFWNAYPNKQAKATASKAWARVQKEPGILETVLRAIEVQKSSEAWQKDGGKFIPHPATWINGRRWEDEMPDTAPSKPKKYKTVIVDGEPVDVEVEE